MKTNKNLLKFIALFAACFVIFTVSGVAQKRKAPTRRAAKTATESTAENSFGTKEGAQKVSIQIKNLTRFLYGFGYVAQVIEDLDKDIKAGKASKDAPDLNQKNKRAVLSTIRDFRAGLAALEVEFRTKPAFKNYLFQINGITDIAGNAEDQANDGQFVESGKTLLLIVEKLSDTLAAMP